MLLCLLMLVMTVFLPLPNSDIFLIGGDPLRTHVYSTFIRERVEKHNNVGHLR